MDACCKGQECFCIHSYKSELNLFLASPYQTQIGVLMWIVKLGSADISTAVSLLESQLLLMKEEHLNAAFNVFAYTYMR